jgi:hypothetical protein
MGNVISNFYSLEREITVIVKSEKEVVVLLAAGIKLQSCCQDCQFILAVCVCDRIFSLEKMFLAIQNYIWFYRAFSSLTCHIIKSSRIYTLYFVDLVKLKSILFLHTRSIYHSFYHFFGPPISSFFPDLREVVQRARPSHNPRGTCPRWADTPAAPGWAEPRS